MPFQREDESNVELAESLGFEVDKSEAIRNGYSFRRGDTHIWQFCNGWQVADLIDGYYRNHRPESSLSAALLSEGKL